jgi:hypothetical protein
MMATIRASCPDCGDVELTTQDMTIRVCADDNRGSYGFRCPECSMTVSKQTEQRIVDLLVSSGVRMETWNLPLELRDRPVGEPLTHDDLLSFHELLEGGDWFVQISRTLGAEELTGIRDGYREEAEVMAQQRALKLAAAPVEPSAPEPEVEVIDTPPPQPTITVRRPRWQDILRSYLHPRV